MTTDEQTPDSGLVKPFLDHLEDLRWTILWSVCAVAVSMAAIAAFAPEILQWIKAPLAATGRDPAVFLKILEVTGGISVTIRVILWSGILLSVPLIVLIIGRFIFPGLRAQEKRAVIGAGALAVILFATGVVLGYTIATPALEIMFWFSTWISGAEPEFVLLTNYVSVVLKLLIAFGLVFELPVVVLALGAMGIVSSRTLRQARRYVIVGLFVLAMMLTPPDPLTQIAMAAPMTLLYEACIWLIWVRERRADGPANTREQE